MVIEDLVSIQTEDWKLLKSSAQSKITETRCKDKDANSRVSSFYPTSNSTGVGRCKNRGTRSK